MDEETAGHLSRMAAKFAVENEGKRRRPRKRAWEPVECEACGNPTTEPVRGFCRACYAKLRRGSPARPGARCQGCGEADLRVLKGFKLDGVSIPLCHNCAHLARHAKPRPTTVEELAQLVRRVGDRRQGGDRRTGRDRRGPVGDRRFLRYGEGDRRQVERRMGVRG